MPGIDPHVSCRRLNLDLVVMPVKQKKCSCNVDREQIMADEVKWEKQAEFIKPVNTQNSLPRWQDSLRRMEIRECALTFKILLMPVRRIVFSYPKLTSLLMQGQDISS